MNFGDFYKELLKYHRANHRDMIRDWQDSEIRTIKKAIENAVDSAGFIGTTMEGFEGKSNQARGNEAEKIFLKLVRPKLKAPFQIEDAPGSGYPDKIFKNGKKGYCMEFKATSKWDDTDTNRRVLTSSPSKLMKLIDDKKVMKRPAHMVAVIVYKGIKVTQFRVYFIDSKTPVNDRLEASTTQKLLSQDSHEPLIIS